MLKLATILDNPGEPQPETRYRDPAELKRLGYNGLVIYETTGLSGLPGQQSVGSGEIARWVQRQFQQVGQTIQRAGQAKLDVYIVYDCLSLSRQLLEKTDADQLTCRNRPTTLCPASESAISESIRGLESLLQMWPELAGVVLRFGDNDAQRLPYLVGNDIYSPHCARCSHLGRADRISLVLTRFHELIVQRHQKRLIARAWNVRPNGMHDSVELCQRLSERLPGDPQDDRFILSFKFSQTDFWRHQRWNPASLVFGRRPIMYELQCQREFEGKGGVPNWQVPLWQQGFAETADSSPVQGLAQVKDRVPLAGLWAWVRGGGWGGPFVRNESWIDANVTAVPRLADDPSTPLATLAHDWASQRLRLKEDAAAISAVSQLLMQSPEAALKAFYISPLAKRPGFTWHPNGDWIQDDLLDVQAAWRIVQRLTDAELDEAIREKQEAVDLMTPCHASLQQTINDANRSTLEPLLNTLIYTQSLYQTLRDLLSGMTLYRRWKRAANDPTLASAAKQKLLSAQAHWNHHTQRQGSLAGCATAFRESQFWEVTQQMLSELPN